MERFWMSNSVFFNNIKMCYAHCVCLKEYKHVWKMAFSVNYEVFTIFDRSHYRGFSRSLSTQIFYVTRTITRLTAIISVATSTRFMFNCYIYLLCDFLLLLINFVAIPTHEYTYTLIHCFWIVNFPKQRNNTVKCDIIYLVFGTKK